MNFARKVWHLLVGIKDALALAFLLVFFTALFAALAARPSPGMVREGALLIDLDGTLVEETAPVDPIAALLSQSLPVREYAARDLVRAIDEAAEDDRIRAIALDLTGFLGGGQVHVQAVAEALARFRAAEKPVFTYAIAYADDHMLLASQADEVWVDPMGGVAITGPGGENLYYAEALERFNIRANVFRVGEFKSAVEPYTQTGMSPQARENIAQVYATLWQEWQASVKRGRPQADIERVTGDVAGWLAASDGDIAEASLAAGLADRIGTRAEWGERIAHVAGEDEWSKQPGAFAMTELDPWLAEIGDGAKRGSKDKSIVVITIAGTISDGDAGPGSAGAERIAGLLDEALASEPAALVVRVDSPGGTVTGSETIRRAILRYREAQIPVAVSMGNYAASGGYWVATPAQRIFAEPETITGSIGVFLVVPSFEDLLAEYGVYSDGIRTTGLSGQPDLLAGLTPETRSVLQASVEAHYGRFLGLVAQSRGITRERADEVGQGQIWDGGAARQLGLVDQFGGLDAAIAWAGAQADLDDGEWSLRFLGEDEAYGSLLARMLAADTAQQGGNDIAARFAQGQFARIERVLGDLEALFAAEGAQARCLACEPLAPPARSARMDASGWFTWLGGLAKK